MTSPHARKIGEPVTRSSVKHGPPLADPPLKLLAYELHEGVGFTLLPAPAARAWMAATPSRFANRCLPLLIANQAGWLVLNGEPVRCCWRGDEPDGVTIDYRQPAPSYGARSHFGDGIVTWNLPFLFRTPSGYNLLVRGPANWIKDGASPLEGIVETDWAPATFTMNWKLTRRGVWVTFDRDEPLCMLVPQRRGELEEFRPEVRPIDMDPDVQRNYNLWVESRARFLRDLRTPGSDAEQVGWQKDYLLGRTADGDRVGSHQTRLRLKPFSRGEPGQPG